jgi:hypothetical protein
LPVVLPLGRAPSRIITPVTAASPCTELANGPDHSNGLPPPRFSRLRSFLGGLARA